MRGTPTLVLIDAQGRLRHRHFGQVSDLVLGAQIAVLAGEAKSIATAAGAKTSHARGCDAQDCLTFA